MQYKSQTNPNITDLQLKSLTSRLLKNPKKRNNIKSYVDIYSPKHFMECTLPSPRQVRRSIEPKLELPPLDKIHPVKELRMVSSVKSQSQPIFEYEKSNKPTARKDTTQHKEKKLEYLQQEILRIKSDKLELTRDLATYEANLAENIQVFPRLAKINGVIGGLPESFKSFQKKQDQNGEFSELLAKSLKKINSLYQSNLPEKTQFQKEDFGVRLENPLCKMKLLLKCAYEVSGIPSIVVVHGNGFNNCFEISVQLASSHMLSVKTEHSLLIRPNQSLKSAVKEQLLSNLFLTLSQDEIILSWTNSYRKDFINLIVEMKGGVVKMIHITKKNEQIVLQLFDPIYTLVLEESKFGCNVFSNDKKVVRALRDHLYYSGDSQGIIWLDNPSDIFKLKEQKSPYLDQEYVRWSLGMIPFQKVWEYNIQFNNEVISVSVLSFKKMERMELRKGVDVVELQEDTPEFKLLRNLQFSKLREAPRTVLNSLELKALIRKLLIT